MEEKRSIVFVTKEHGTICVPDVGDAKVEQQPPTQDNQVGTFVVGSKYNPIAEFITYDVVGWYELKGDECTCSE